MKDDRLLEMRVFKAVLDHGGFTAAAHALGASQPFVSRTIAALEARLGVKLLHRSTRGRRLTEEGQRYLQASSQIIDAVEQADQLASVGHAAASGDLRVSAPADLGTSLLVPLVPRFLDDNPGIRLSLQLSNEPVQLFEDNIDIAIHSGRIRDTMLRSHRLCELRHLIVGSPAYLKRRGWPEAPEMLRDHNCLLKQRASGVQDSWPFKIKGVHQEITVAGNLRSGHNRDLLALCLADFGIMRLCETIALPLTRSGALKILLGEFQSDTATIIHATYLPERQALPRLRAFLDMLVHAVEPTPWREKTAAAKDCI